MSMVLRDSVYIDIVAAMVGAAFGGTMLETTGDADCTFGDNVPVAAETVAEDTAFGAVDEDGPLGGGIALETEGELDDEPDEPPPSFVTSRPIAFKAAPSLRTVSIFCDCRAAS